jgi:hypothetical protein
MRGSRPLPNRVDPFGQLIASPERGALMGNRGGRFHLDDQTLGRRRWASRQWIACVCEFKNRRRDVWGAGYTELFFLDEPTALAAGHRPCFECRRGEALAFRDAFPGAARPSAAAIDEVLHAERQAAGAKLALLAPLDDLPDGAMIDLEGAAWLVAGDSLRRWSPAGYGAPVPRAARGVVRLITPPSIVAALRNGYRGTAAPAKWRERLDAPAAFPA